MKHIGNTNENNMALEEIKKLIENHRSERVEMKEWGSPILFDGQENYRNRTGALTKMGREAKVTARAGW